MSSGVTLGVCSTDELVRDSVGSELLFGIKQPN